MARLHETLYHNGFLDGLLNLHAFSWNGLIQFPLKGQQIHVGLRLGDQVSDLITGHQQSMNHSTNQSEVWVKRWKSSYPLRKNLVSHLAPLCSTVREKQVFFHQSIVMNSVLWAHWQDYTWTHVTFSLFVFIRFNGCNFANFSQCFHVMLSL